MLLQKIMCLISNMKGMNSILCPSLLFLGRYSGVPPMQNDDQDQKLWSHMIRHCPLVVWKMTIRILAEQLRRMTIQENEGAGRVGNIGSFAVDILNWGACYTNIPMQMLSSQLALWDGSSGDKSKHRVLGAVSMQMLCMFGAVKATWRKPSWRGDSH